MITRIYSSFVNGNEINLFTKDESFQSKKIVIPQFISTYNKHNPDLEDARQSHRHIISRYDPNFVWCCNLDPDIIYEDENWEEDETYILSQFFLCSGIEPYSWIKINRFEIDQGLIKTTIFDIGKFIEGGGIVNLHPSSLVPSQFLENKKVAKGKLYWDIETLSLSNNFTTPKEEDSYIKCISIIISISLNDRVVKKQGFIIHSITPVNKDELDIDLDIDFSVEYLNTEREIIARFFEIWMFAGPDYIVQYNGYSFDIYFVTMRALKYGLQLPSLWRAQEVNEGKKRGKFASLSLGHKTKVRRYQSALGFYERKVSWVGYETEDIDLLYFFRKYYPEYKNHKLDTVSLNILNRGKTDMTINRMFEIFKTGDKEGAKEVLKYSIIDTYLLYELDNSLSILNKIEKACNAVNMSMEDFLSSDPSLIIRNLCYKLDPVTIIYKLDKTQFNKINLPVGISQNLIFYDYTNLALSEIEKHKDNIGYLGNDFDILDILGSLPLSYILMFIETLLCPEEVRLNLKEMFKLLNPIYLDQHIMGFYRTSEPIKSPYFREILHEDYRFVFDDHNYISVLDNKIIRKGLASISKPMFEYVEKYVDSTILGIIEGIGKGMDLKPLIPEFNIHKVPIEDLAITIKLKSSDMYKSKKEGKNIHETSHSKYYILSKKYEDEIGPIYSWVTIKYFVLRWDNYTFTLPDPNYIDFDFYASKLNMVRQKIVDII